MRFRILYILLLQCSCLAIYSQTTNEGTEFWMSFMQHRNIGDNKMVVMITSTNNTSGTVSIPGLGFSTGFNVAANDVTLITMPASAETVGSERVQQNAIQVISNDPVSVYIHQYGRVRSEASIVLPTQSLSNDYYVLCYTGIDQDNDGASEFIVVGIEDETTVSILLSSDSKRNSKNERLNITLQQGETYQVRGRDIRSDFSDTQITGDKMLPFLRELPIREFHKHVATEIIYLNKCIPSTRLVIHMSRHQLGLETLMYSGFLH